MPAVYDLLETPLGTLFIGASERGLHRIEWLSAEGEAEEDADLARRIEALARDARCDRTERDPQRLSRAIEQLRAYFAGERSTFDLPLAARGTDFQRAVWQRLCAIQPGKTATYGEVAQAIGRPNAARATGAAIGRNPLSIVVPCHRVIGRDGALTGFGGGLERKRWLLTHEGALVDMA